MKQPALKHLLAALACCGAVFCGGAAAGGRGQKDVPPDVVITSPDESAAPVEHEELTVRVTVLSYDIELTDFAVTLNGEKVFSKSYKAPQVRDRLEFPVRLRPGLNELTAVATNRFGASRPATRRVTFAPAARTGDANLYVLSVGIGKYRSEKMRLDFAEDDARAVAAAFERMRGRRPFRDVRTRVLPNEAATREAILDGLKWLNEAAGGERDVRVVFVSGRTAGIGGATYLLSPADDSPEGSLANDLRLGLVWEVLSSGRGAAVVFADLALSDFRPSAAGAAQGVGRGGQRGSYVWDGEVNSFIAAIEDEVPLRRADWGHSAFAKSLLDGLGGKARMDDGCVELDELSDWLDDDVRRLSGGRQSVFVLLHKRHKETRLTCPNG